MTTAPPGLRRPQLTGLDPSALRLGLHRPQTQAPSELAGPRGRPSDPPTAHADLPGALHDELCQVLQAGLSAPLPGPQPAGLPQRALPRHVERIDPTWLLVDAWGHPLSPRSPALPLLPRSLRNAVCRALGTRAPEQTGPPPPLAAAAARHAWGHLVDMPPGLERDAHTAAPAEEDGPALAAWLPRLAPVHLRALVAGLGAEPLGALLAQIPRRAAALLCSRITEPLRAAVWQARAAGGDAPPPGRPPHTVLQDLARSPGTTDPDTVLFALGAGRAAAFLQAHRPPARGQCAQLLPKPAGCLLLQALEAAPPPAAAAVARHLRALR